MQPIPLGITVEQDEYLQNSSENLVNLYPELTPRGKQSVSLKQTPGLDSHATVGTAIRGVWVMNGKRYVVSGTSLYVENPLGTFTSLGTIPGTGLVGMAANDRSTGPQLMVVNGTTTGYVYSEDAGFSTITLTGAAYTVAYQDGYFLFDWYNTGKWFISNVNNGLQFDSTEVGATNSRPDNVLAVFSKKAQIWVCGSETFEVFVNNANPDFPFEKINEVTIDDVGLGERNTLVYGDNAFYFIGDDRLPYRTKGYGLEIIGNDSICQALESVDLSQIVCTSFKWRTHFFYQINLPNGIAYRFDAKTSLWHTVRGWSSGYAAYRGGRHHYFNGNHYMADIANGNIYQLKKDTLTDNGTLIRREVTTPFIHNNGMQFSVNRIRADFEAGVGNTNATNPVVLLQWSNDGHNWSTPIPGFVGQIGNYKTQVWWNSLGTHYQIAYRLWWTDSIDTTLLGLYGS